jgi:hypothetical protein
MPAISPASIPGILQPGTHANRPAASALAAGALWLCSTHKVIYQTDGTTWTTAYDPIGSVGTVSALTFVIDGGGSAITTGVKGDIEVPFACTITAARLFADQTGSIVVDIWKDTYANFPPVVGDSITASAKPTLSSAIKAQNTTLTGWTTSIAAGDVLRFNVDSITTCTRVTVSLSVTRV